MMGDKRCRSLEAPGTYPVPKLQEVRHEESMMGGKRSRFPKTPGTTIRLPSCKKGGKRTILGPPAPPSGSQATQATRRETGGDYDGRQDLAIFRDQL